MKYMCKTCNKKCDDITKHLMTVHKFSKGLIESQLKANPNSYVNAFENLKKDRSKTTIHEKAITREPNKKERFIIKLICLFILVLNLDLIN